jgi:hypothetical protein
VIPSHLFVQQALGYKTLVDTLSQQAKKEALLIPVGMTPVSTKKRVFAENASSDLHQPVQRKKTLARCPINGEAGFPGLSEATGIM